MSPIRPPPTDVEQLENWVRHLAAEFRANIEQLGTKSDRFFSQLVDQIVPEIIELRRDRDRDSNRIDDLERRVGVLEAAAIKETP